MAYKHIGVAISGNEEDALLVNKALELARHNDAHLTLIHIDDGLSELYPGIYFPATEDILQLLKNKSDNKLYKLTKNIQWPKTKLRIERGNAGNTAGYYATRAVRPPCLWSSPLIYQPFDASIPRDDQ